MLAQVVARRLLAAQGGRGAADAAPKCGIYVLDVNQYAAEADVPKCRLEDIVVAGWTQARCGLAALPAAYFAAPHHAWHQ